VCLGHVPRKDFVVSPLIHNISVVKLFNFSWVTGQHFDWQLYILRSGDEDLRLNLDGAFVLVDLEAISSIKTYVPSCAKTRILRDDPVVHLLGSRICNLVGQ
jgi:hypothetical protein